MEFGTVISLFSAALGLADKRIIFYNAALLFVILYVAYPLRFAFDSFFSFMVGLLGNHSRITSMELTFEKSGVILGYFAVGYGVIQFLFALMYRHAIKKSGDFNLTETEIIEARTSLYGHYALIVISASVAITAPLTPLNGFTGWLYFLSWPIAILIDRSLKSKPPQT